MSDDRWRSPLGTRYASPAMLALVLMVGIVIDDALVVLENTFRFMGCRSRLVPTVMGSGSTEGSSSSSPRSTAAPCSPS